MSDTKDDSPTVISADVLGPMPTRADAEAVWRKMFADRMVARGIDREDADACAAAGSVDLSESPEDAADAELECWDADE